MSTGDTKDLEVHARMSDVESSIEELGENVANLSSRLDCVRSSPGDAEPTKTAEAYQHRCALGNRAYLVNADIQNLNAQIQTLLRELEI